MKKILISILLCYCTCAMCQQANFVSNGIVYGITSETNATVEVLPYSYLLSNPYSGSISIPQTVEHEGATYQVTALGESAFQGCTGITSLNIPSSIKSIGSYCFYNCSFTTLQLPDSLRSIGDHAFLYSRVSSLHLPAHFSEYGEAAFWARNLTSITVDEANPYYRSIDGWLYSKDSLTLYVAPDGISGTVCVPSYVQHLGDMAFGFCQNITSVSLPEGLTRIGAFAFNCCARVNNVVIPSSVTRIGICPFSYCPQLTNLTIASGNTHYVMDSLLLYSINYDTLVSCHKSGATVTMNPNVKVLGGFENNTWVRNIEIPSGVTDISDHCFSGCSFSTIALPEHMKSIGAAAFASNSRLSSITMPQSLLKMGEGAFAWCERLAAVAIPDSLRIIPKEAFNSCPRLASITWGNAVEEIGYAAFWAMASSSLDLPATLKRLDDYAFAACANNLREVTFHGQLDTMGEAVFRNANLEYIRFVTANPPVVTGVGPLDQVGRLDSLIIPCGSLNTWLADSYWGQFADKYSESCEGIDDAVNGEISIYPNPATDWLAVRTTDNSCRVELINALGQVILSSEATGNSSRIDVSGLSRGIYLLRLSTTKSQVIEKVILQ